MTTTVHYAPSTVLATDRQYRDFARRIPRDTPPLDHANLRVPPGFVAAMDSRPAAPSRAVSLGKYYNHATRDYLPPSPGSVHEYGYRPPAWMGTDRLGRGSYGSVYSVRVTAEVRRVLREIRDAASSVVRGELPPVGATVAVKLAIFYDPKLRKDTKLFLQRNVLEAATHDWLLERPPVAVEGCSRPLHARDHLPRLYFAGLARSDEGGAMFVTVMDRVQGASTTCGALDARAYVALERAVCSLWVNGVMHDDLHCGNVLYDARHGAAKIIDLGLATTLPTPLVPRIVKELGAAIARDVPSLGEMFRKGRGASAVQRYVNRAMLTREGMTVYFADYLMLLRHFFNRLSASQKKAVPQLRRAAWGFGGAGGGSSRGGSSRGSGGGSSRGSGGGSSRGSGGGSSPARDTPPRHNAPAKQPTPPKAKAPKAKAKPKPKRTTPPAPGLIGRFLGRLQAKRRD